MLWDVDPKDWATSNSSVIAQRVLGDVEENDIILLHDASESSVLAAFKIIDELKSQGYTFVTVEEILQMCIRDRRMGIAAGPAEVIFHMNKIHQFTTMSAGTTSPYAALEALTSTVRDEGMFAIR